MPDAREDRPNCTFVRTATKDETFRIDLILGISDRSQIEKLCRSFKSIPGIMEAYRGKG